MYQCCPDEILNLCLTGFKSVNGTEWICSTCHANLKSGKMLSCAKANEMGFPMIPDSLKNLTPLEERLISPCIPFMQVRELPTGGQLSIHGNIVNVPSDVSSTVNVLPRPINESATVPIKLKRRLSYEHHYQFQNVRPLKVLEAAKYLVNTSDIFQNEGIQIATDYEESSLNVDEEWSEFIDHTSVETFKHLPADLRSQNEENVETGTSNNEMNNDDI